MGFEGRRIGWGGAIFAGSVGGRVGEAIAITGLAGAWVERRRMRMWERAIARESKVGWRVLVELCGASVVVVRCVDWEWG